MAIFTYKDALDHAVYFLGGSLERDRHTCLAAIHDAYRELANAHRWSYYYGQRRIDTVASYSTGTITYTNSTRTVTLASGTWPSWAAYGTIVISNEQYQVASRTSDSAIILSVNSNPGANVAAGTSYTLYRDVYPLPSDFLAMDNPVALGTGNSWLRYVRPSDWLNLQYQQNSPGTPSFFTIKSDPNFLGTLAIALSPPPDSVIHYDVMCQRSPRPLQIVDYHDGTVTVGASSATVTGTSTSWASKHEGAVIRLADNGTNVPTGLEGLYPFEVERIVKTVGGATSITADSDYSAVLTAVKYIISDPVDVENTAMLTAFRRGIELQLARNRRMKDMPMTQAAYDKALRLALEADARSFARRHAGPSVLYTDSISFGDDVG